MVTGVRIGEIYWSEKDFSPFVEGDADTLYVAGKTLIRVNDSSTNAVALGIAGGGVRIPMGGDDADTGQMYGPLAFEPDESGLCSMWCRFRISDVSVSSVFVGFTDQVAASEVPIHDEGGTLAHPADDAVGVLLEGEQDITWQTVSTQNDATHNQSVATNIDDLTDNEFTTVMVQISPDNSGQMRVVIDGKVLVTANANYKSSGAGAGFTGSYLRSSIVFAPVISADDRAGAYNLDIVEFGWRGGVGAAIV